MRIVIQFISVIRNIIYPLKACYSWLLTRNVRIREVSVRFCSLSLCSAILGACYFLGSAVDGLLWVFVRHPRSFSRLSTCCSTSVDIINVSYLFLATSSLRPPCLSGLSLLCSSSDVAAGACLVRSVAVSSVVRSHALLLLHTGSCMWIDKLSQYASLIWVTLSIIVHLSSVFSSWHAIICYIVVYWSVCCVSYRSALLGKWLAWIASIQIRSIVRVVVDVWSPWLTTSVILLYTALMRSNSLASISLDALYSGRLHLLSIYSSWLDMPGYLLLSRVWMRIRMHWRWFFCRASFCYSSNEVRIFAVSVLVFAYFTYGDVVVSARESRSRRVRATKDTWCA